MPHSFWIAYLTALLGTEVSPVTPHPSSDELTILTTPGGVRYGLIGDRGNVPAPILFVFAGALETSLTHPIYSQTCRILTGRGAMCVTVDLPSHGKRIQPDEPEGLKGWRHRVDRGEDPMEELVVQASEVLDHLVAEGIADPEHALASGTSRGGYAAMRLAAGDERVAAVAAFSPVTDLRALREFEGLEKQEVQPSLQLIEHAQELAKCNLWLIIGDNDQRVSTDSTVKLALEVSKVASRQRLSARVELRVEPAKGHRVPKGAYQRAGQWLLRQAGIK